MKHLLLFAAGLMVGANLVYFLLHRDGRVAPETVPPAVFAQPANTQADPAPGTRPPPSSQPAVTTPATLRAATGVQSPPAGSLMLPVAGIQANELTDTFNQTRDGTRRRHEALDIMAARGTPVVAASDGTVVKLFTSVPGGLTVYEFDPTQAYAYYYAHLDHYAAGLAEGQVLHRGDVIGYVGSTGNASEDAPHLHFAIFLLGAEKQWWKGTPINPYPLLARAQ